MYLCLSISFILPAFYFPKILSTAHSENDGTVEVDINYAMFKLLGQQNDILTTQATVLVEINNNLASIANSLKALADK